MYKLTASSGRLPVQSASTQNFSRPQRIRGPVSENARRPRSPAMATFDDPMTCGAPDVQKSRPIRYASSTSTTSWESPSPRRPPLRSARSVSPMRSERIPAHIRARTPPAALPQPYKQGGFLAPTPAIDREEPSPSLRTRSRSEGGGREPECTGLRDGMVPGPDFFEQAARRTNPRSLSPCPRTPELSATNLDARTPPTMPLPPTPKVEQKATTTPPLKSRKSTPSMHDYMTLEQLEDLWKNDDMTGGLVEAPPIQAPRFTMEQILEARRQMGDIGIHPAFRGNSQTVN